MGDQGENLALSAALSALQCHLHKQQMCTRGGLFAPSVTLPLKCWHEKPPYFKTTPLTEARRPHPCTLAKYVSRSCLLTGT